MNWHVVISNGRTEFHELWWFSVLASTNFFFRRFTAVVVAKCRPLLADGLLFYPVPVPVTVSERMGETLSELLTPQYKMLTWWWIKMGNLFHSRCALFILFTSNFTLSLFLFRLFFYNFFFIHESSTFYTLGYKREVYSSAFIYFVPLKSVRLHPSNVTLIL